MEVIKFVEDYLCNSQPARLQVIIFKLNIEHMFSKLDPIHIIHGLKNVYIFLKAAKYILVGKKQVTFVF